MTEVDRRETAADAALSGGLLLAVLVAGAVVDAAVSPSAVVAGGVATVLAEVVAGRFERRVRRAWRRPTVTVGALCLAAGGIAAGAVVAPTPALSLAGGALLSYLLLLALVTLGVLPPPGEW